MRPATVLRFHSRFAGAVLLAGMVGGCSLPAVLSQSPQARGNLIEAERLAQLVPGTSTRADVTSLIGSPTAKAVFDDSKWIYIGELTRPVIGGTNAVLDQQTVVMSFDGKGVLQSMDTKLAKDGYDIAIVTDTTPAPGSDASFLQQLLGNIGRFNPGAGAGATGGGASSTNRSSGGNY